MLHDRKKINKIAKTICSALPWSKILEKSNSWLNLDLGVFLDHAMTSQPHLENRGMTMTYGVNKWSQYMPVWGKLKFH